MRSSNVLIEALNIRTKLFYEDTKEDLGQTIIVDEGAPKIPLTQKGAANGVATLGADSKVPDAQLPDLAINDIFPVADQAGRLALTAQVGDVAVQADNGNTYMLRVQPATVDGNWTVLPIPTGVVTSVNGVPGPTVVVPLGAAFTQASPTPSLAVPANGVITITHPVEATGKIIPVAKIYEASPNPTVIPDAWLAFDNSIATRTFFPNSVVMPAFLEIDLGVSNAQIITKYGVVPSFSGICIRTWVFEGSNDGLSWTALDSQSDKDSSFWTKDVESLFVFSNISAYRYYRLNIVSAVGYGAIGIEELNLYTGALVKYPDAAMTALNAPSPYVASFKDSALGIGKWNPATIGRPGSVNVDVEVTHDDSTHTTFKNKTGAPADFIFEVVQ